MKEIMKEYVKAILIGCILTITIFSTYSVIKLKSIETKIDYIISDGTEEVEATGEKTVIEDWPPIYGDKLVGFETLSPAPQETIVDEKETQVLDSVNILGYSDVAIYLTNLSKDKSFFDAIVKASSDNTNWTYLYWTACDQLQAGYSCTYSLSDNPYKYISAYVVSENKIKVRASLTAVKRPKIICEECDEQINNIWNHCGSNH